MMNFTNDEVKPMDDSKPLNSIQHPYPNINRKERRRLGKVTGMKHPGIQDPKEATLQVYWIPLKRKSRAGVEYVYYKKVVDVIGLKK